MKEFPAPMVTISHEEHQQLTKCRDLIKMLWTRFGPYEWPREFQLPKGKTFRDFPEHSDEFKFYSGFRSTIDWLMEFDDSE